MPCGINVSFKDLIFNRIVLTLSDKTSEDPTHGGNNIDSILTPDPSKAPTTRSLLVGFTISSPKPRLPVLNIPEFNATEGMSEGVFPDGGTAPKNTGRPLLPSGDNTDERPSLPSTPSNQTIGRPSIKGLLPWNEIVKDWRAADDDFAQSVVDAWTGLCEWGVPAAATPATATAGDGEVTIAGATAMPYIPLKVQKPTMILGTDGLDTFGEYYVGCPFVTG
jgi:hypothetical protein